VPEAHAGRLFLVGKALVALKIEKVIESIESTMRLQLKFTPRRKNFAIRTLVLIFCGQMLVMPTILEIDFTTYQISRLFLLGQLLMFLQDLFLSEGGAQRIIDLPSRRPWGFHGTL